MFTHLPLIIARTFAAILLIIAGSNTTEATEDTTSVPPPTIEPQISSGQDSPTSIPTQEVGNPSDVDILGDRPTDIFEDT